VRQIIAEMLNPLLRAAKENIILFNKQSHEIKEVNKKLEETCFVNAKLVRDIE
jgi:hypothetical protein